MFAICGAEAGVHRRCVTEGTRRGRMLKNAVKPRVGGAECAAVTVK